MFWHVFERARQCKSLSSVALATDDNRIRLAAQQWRIPVVMTRNDHPSGTDRVLEAAEKLKLETDSVIVNIQGDEPVLEPAMLTQLLKPFSEPDIQVTTLARKINTAESDNPDLVKVVFTADNRALYFSRSPIPFQRNATDPDIYGHIGIYAFRMPILKKFVALDQGRLEVTERLEQLRLLENDIPIHIVETEHQCIGVDRPEDIETVTNILMQKREGKALSGKELIS